MMRGLSHQRAPGPEALLGRLKQSSEVEVGVTGRKTKRRISAPVWFVVDGRIVVLVPTKGSESQWFKNLLKNPEVELRAGGVSVSAKASIVRDSMRTEKAVAELRAKYRSMWSESYYSKRDVCIEVAL